MYRTWFAGGLVARHYYLELSKLPQTPDLSDTPFNLQVYAAVIKVSSSAPFCVLIMYLAT